MDVGLWWPTFLKDPASPLMLLLWMAKRLAGYAEINPNRIAAVKSLGRFMRAPNGAKKILSLRHKRRLFSFWLLLSSWAWIAAMRISRYTAGAMPAGLLIQALSLFFFRNLTWGSVETGSMEAGSRARGLAAVSWPVRLKIFRYAESVFITHFAYFT